MPNDLNISQFDSGVMPIGEYVDLAVDQTYYFVAQARGIWMGAVARAKGLPQKFKFIPEIGMPFEVKGKDWSQIIVFSLAQGQNTGLTNLNVVMQTSTSFQKGYAAMLGQGYNAAQSIRGYSITRMLEYIAPFGITGNQYINAVIASGGADVTAILSMANGDLMSIDWAITQDALGTSPHASYLSVVDTSGNKLLYALGAGNYSGTKTVRMVINGYVTITAHNGDTVAHTFFCNIYRMGA